MLTSLVLFMNSTSQSWIPWSIFVWIKQKNNFNNWCRPHCIWSRTISCSFTSKFQNFQIRKSLWPRNAKVLQFDRTAKNFMFYRNTANNKKNSKLKFVEIFLYMHYDFPNRNFSYSQNFAPNLNNFIESENNAAQVFLILTVLLNPILSPVNVNWIYII